ncbi:MAG: hypothetical protein LBU06_11720 [Desulfovibrio sp.]|jgi:hypothetical protein|nr:hypothetical protein [Desulfovibrio sp.]
MQDMRRRERKDEAGSLPESRRRELWLYIFVFIGTVEFLLAVGALLFAFVNGGSAPDGRFLPAFPWLSYSALALLVPSLILLAAHLADVGLFRPPRLSSQSGEGARAQGENGAQQGTDGAGGETSSGEDRVWQNLLPERMQRFYNIIRAAPLVVLLVGAIAFGAVLLTLDGALSALGRFADVLIPHARALIVCAAVLIGIFTLGVLLLNYRTRKLIAEYEFRREVLEKTGIVILDKGARALPADGVSVPYAVLSGESGEIKALPRGGGVDRERGDEDGADNGA